MAQMRKKSKLKVLSFAMAIIVASAQSSIAMPGIGVSVAPGGETPGFLQIEIPHDIATIEDIYEAPAKPDPKLILHVQNIHGNYESQVQIKKLLEYLYQRYGFKLIFAEGAVEKLDSEILRFFPDKERNLKLADLMAKHGDLTGIEYFLMDGPKDVAAVGIENAELYRLNYEAFKKVIRGRDLSDRYLELFEGKLETLASRIFTANTRRLLSEWRKFEAGQRDFLPYVKRLAIDARNVLGLDLESLFSQVEWPQITRLLALQSMEQELNAKSAGIEKDRLVQFLTEKRISVEVIQAIQKLHEKKITMTSLDQNQRRLEDLPRYLFERLVEEAGPKGFRFQDYPAFSLWAGHLILQHELDSKVLFEEIESVFEKILNELTVNEREKNLLELYRDEILLRKLLHLELTRKEWDRVEYRKDWMALKTMQRRLRKLSEETSDVKALDETLWRKLMRQETSGVRQLLATSYEFYNFARKRDAVFYDTIEKQMAEAKTDKAVLVTGGFHTDGLMELFRQQEINCSVLMPRVAGDFDNSGYITSMLENRQPNFDITTLEAILKGQSAAAISNQGGNLDYLYNLIARYANRVDGKTVITPASVRDRYDRRSERPVAPTSTPSLRGAPFATKSSTKPSEDPLRFSSGQSPTASRAEVRTPEEAGEEEINEALRGVIELLAKREPLPDKVDLIMVFGSDDAKVPEEAARLYHEGKAPRILVSGRFGKDVAEDGKTIPEAHRYRDRLIGLGISESAILVEDQSKNMEQNAEYSRNLLQREGLIPKSVILIHSPLLQIRGAGTARQTLAPFNTIIYDHAAYIPEIPNEKTARDQLIDRSIKQSKKITERLPNTPGLSEIQQRVARLEQVISRAEARSAEPVEPRGPDFELLEPKSDLAVVVKWQSWSQPAPAAGYRIWIGNESLFASSAADFASQVKILATKVGLRGFSVQTVGDNIQLSVNNEPVSAPVEFKNEEALEQTLQTAVSVLSRSESRALDLDTENDFKIIYGDEEAGETLVYRYTGQQTNVYELGLALAKRLSVDVADLSIKITGGRYPGFHNPLEPESADIDVPSNNGIRVRINRSESRSAEAPDAIRPSVKTQMDEARTFLSQVRQVFENLKERTGVDVQIPDFTPISEAIRAGDAKTASEELPTIEKGLKQPELANVAGLRENFDRAAQLIKIAASRAEARNLQLISGDEAKDEWITYQYTGPQTNVYKLGVALAERLSVDVTGVSIKITGGSYPGFHNPLEPESADIEVPSNNGISVRISRSEARSIQEELQSIQSFIDKAFPIVKLKAIISPEPYHEARSFLSPEEFRQLEKDYQQIQKRKVTEPSAASRTYLNRALIRYKKWLIGKIGTVSTQDLIEGNSQPHMVRRIVNKAVVGARYGDFFSYAQFKKFIILTWDAEANAIQSDVRQAIQSDNEAYFEANIFAVTEPSNISTRTVKGRLNNSGMEAMMAALGHGISDIESMIRRMPPDEVQSILSERKQNFSWQEALQIFKAEKHQANAEKRVEQNKLQEGKINADNALIEASHAMSLKFLEDLQAIEKETGKKIRDIRLFTAAVRDYTGTLKQIDSLDQLIQFVREHEEMMIAPVTIAHPAEGAYIGFGLKRKEEFPNSANARNFSIATVNNYKAHLDSALAEITRSKAEIFVRSETRGVVLEKDLVTVRENDILIPGAYPIAIRPDGTIVGGRPLNDDASILQRAFTNRRAEAEKVLDTLNTTPVSPALRSEVQRFANMLANVIQAPPQRLVSDELEGPKTPFSGLPSFNIPLGISFLGQLPAFESAAAALGPAFPVVITAGGLAGPDISLPALGRFAGIFVDQKTQAQQKGLAGALEGSVITPSTAKGAVLVSINLPSLEPRQLNASIEAFMLILQAYPNAHVAVTIVDRSVARGARLTPEQVNARLGLIQSKLREMAEGRLTIILTSPESARAAVQTGRRALVRGLGQSVSTEDNIVEFYIGGDKTSVQDSASLSLAENTFGMIIDKSSLAKAGALVNAGFLSSLKTALLKENLADITEKGFGLRWFNNNAVLSKIAAKLNEALASIRTAISA